MTRHGTPQPPCFSTTNGLFLDYRPSSAKARLNIRFNPAHKGKDLAAWIEAECRAAAEGFSGRVEVLSKISGEAFLTEPGAFTDVIVAAVTDATGRAPELSTTGGGVTGVATTFKVALLTFIIKPFEKVLSLSSFRFPTWVPFNFRKLLSKVKLLLPRILK